jgi:hypothetical protein
MERTALMGMRSFRPSASGWLQVIVGSLGAFLLAVAVTATFYVHPVRMDLSPGDRFTLSDHGLSVLRGLQEPVRITSFIRTEDPRNPVLKDLLWQASNESPQITYTVVDVNRNPALASQYGVATYGATVVEAGEKKTQFTLPVESQLISALLHVTRPPRKIYALEGHGECDLGSTDRYSGCSGLRDALSNELYKIESLTLRDGRDVPKDADAILVLGPRADLLEVEIATLGKYLDGGGNLLLLADPFAAPRLAAFLVPRGIELGANVVIDPENRLGGGEAFSAAVPDVNRRHSITQALDAPPLFSAARAIETHDDPRGTRTAQWLAKSGEHSWASHDPAILEGAEARFVAGRDLNGPLTVGAEVWYRLGPARSADDPEAEAGEIRTSRIVVFGDSDFVTNRFLDYLGNRDLALNSVNALVRENRLMAPRSRSKEPGVNWLFISQAELRNLFMTAVLGQPLLFLAIGVGAFLRRRLSP